MPAARAESIVLLARAIDGKDFDLSIERLLAIPGVGPWTASYVAMRVLKRPDAFPAGDLGIRKALSVDRASDAEARAESWRPWRAYAVMHLWTSLAKGG
jgi:AraC family transcriptional regulator, regulatory protein of adaptative response / DNA-3-methyladenine glycosylase II